jgi:hypothetical protein
MKGRSVFAHSAAFVFAAFPAAAVHFHPIVQINPAEAKRLTANSRKWH